MNPYARYRHEQVTSASGPELVLLLLNELRRRVRLASAALQAGDRPGARPHFDRSHRILFALGSALDPAAGELAGHLAALYAEVQHQLFAAEEAGDAARCDGAAAALDNLADAWRTAMAQAGGSGE